MSPIEAALKELNSLGGDKALFDEVRCRGILADRLANDPGRSAAALAVLRTGIAARLRTVTQALAQETVDREKSLLTREHAVAPQLAGEAVAAWARTLGLTVAEATGLSSFGGGIMDWFLADKRRWQVPAIALVAVVGIWMWGGSEDNWKSFGLTQDKVDRLSLRELTQAAVNEAGYNKIKERSDAGNPLGQALACLAAAYGIGTPQDYNAAQTLCNDAAAKKQAIAELMLYHLYQEGNNPFPKDDRVAEQHLRAAANMNDPRAALALSQAYYNGTDFTPSDNAPGEQNRRKAFEWAVKAAATKLPSGLDNLGLMYQLGVGTAVDLKTAFDNYKESAQAGYARGMFDVAYCYNSGSGVTENNLTARDWYKKASDAGIAVASRNLGIMYQNGELGTPDNDSALFYFRLALKQGDAASADLIRKLGQEP